jgi:hypothetical protein
MFIKIQNRILDKDKLRRQQTIVKNHIIISIYDLLRIHGFEKMNDSFTNKDLNLNLNFEFENLEKETIV